MNTFNNNTSTSETIDTTSPPNVSTTIPADNISFVTTDVELLEFPFITRLFSKIDKVIEAEFQGRSESDKVRVRRLIAGHVAENDLIQLVGYFKKCPVPKKKGLTKWTAFIQVMSEELDDFNIKDQMPMISAKYNRLDSDPELLEKVNKKLEESLQPTVLMEDYEGLRPKKYRQDINNLRNNLKYLQDNYRTHLVVTGVCDTSRQLDFPPFTLLNSGNKHK